jgi:magnesium transporter
MSEVVEGLAGPQRARITALRERSRFFWVDVSAGESSRDDVRGALGIDGPALDVVLDFGEATPPSRKLHVDGRQVVFAFSCFLPTAVDVRVLVRGDFLLTVHEQRLSLPDRLAVGLPEGRSGQYVVYAVLDAMLASAFDALDGVERTLGTLTLQARQGAARVQLPILREINARLGAIRQSVAPQRSGLHRVIVEMPRIRGPESHGEQGLDRLAAQLDRLVDAIDAAGDGMAKLMDLRLNETLYWLTVVATVFLPLTFVTGFFGMNFDWMVSQIDTPLAFLVLGVGAPALAGASMVAVIRRRGTPIELDADDEPRRR